MNLLLTICYDFSYSNMFANCIDLLITFEIPSGTFLLLVRSLYRFLGPHTKKVLLCIIRNVSPSVGLSDHFPGCGILNYRPFIDGLYIFRGVLGHF